MQLLKDRINHRSVLNPRGIIDERTHAMIEIQHGDILRADAEALVNTVNCVGVMGRGIALQFKKAFPENFKAYKAVCDRKEMKPGMVLIHDLNRLANPNYIINFPTKRHWKGKSRMEDIDSGLIALANEVRGRDIQSIAIPPLGCGLGGLDWREVRLRIERTFNKLPNVQILLYEPKGAPSPEVMAKSGKYPNMTEGRAALLGLMRRYLSAVMEPYITLLEIHKLMYFMQEAGQNLKLNFTKGPYGPYAENLRHVLTHIEGHFIEGYGDAADHPEKEINPKIEAMVLAEKYLKDHPDVQDHFEQVSHLIEGFETAYGMELLSTVYWVIRHENATSLKTTIEKTHAWNERKQMFTKDHISVTRDVLRKRKWLTT